MRLDRIETLVALDAMWLARVVPLADANQAVASLLVLSQEEGALAARGVGVVLAQGGAGVPTLEV